MKEIVIVGGGVAGSEAGTHISSIATQPLSVKEVECDEKKKFGGWGFQSFPITEYTNLAMRKMYLSKNPKDIFDWVENDDRSKWPRDFDFHPDEPFPRSLMQHYVKWRRFDSHQRPLPIVKYSTIIDEAIGVYVYYNDHFKSDRVIVKMKSGRRVECDKLIMASGSISVKIPPYLESFKDEAQVIIDPLNEEGHQRRSQIPEGSKVLVIGMGLTGEEQANVLFQRGDFDLTLFSRGGQRHFRYEEKQHNEPLVIKSQPTFLESETPEEFNQELGDFFGKYLNEGRSPEDIFAAIRPYWDQMRASIGGCVKSAERLRRFKRELATMSIGVSWDVSEMIDQAEKDGKLKIKKGEIDQIKKSKGRFQVKFKNGETETYDWLINAVGRNIIRHPIWDRMLEEGIAKKHAGIGIRVDEKGRLVNKDNKSSNSIWVVGMARAGAGDHALRHGFLGNTAFNVPQVRSHVYDTVEDLMETIQ